MLNEMYCFLTTIDTLWVSIITASYDENREGSLSMFERWKNIKKCNLCASIPTSCVNH